MALPPASVQPWGPIQWERYPIARLSGVPGSHARHWSRDRTTLCPASWSRAALRARCPDCGHGAGTWPGGRHPQHGRRCEHGREADKSVARLGQVANASQAW